MRRVIIALILTGAFMIVEVIGGIIAGSLALLADAGHMLTDTMALALAAVAFHVSRRPADSRRTFGYQRFQILAAFVNGLSLLVIVGWILVEAVRRFISPHEVMGQTMLIVAGAGLVVNIIAFVVLHGGDRDNLNIRGAALHVAGDMLGSVAAIVAAIVIIYTGWLAVDPLLSIAVAFLILKSAWALVRQSGHVLLEGAPDCTPQDLMLTMHLKLESPVDNHTTVVRDVKAVLRENFGIDHSTIEVEVDDCADH
jgi:cobalt-zinc-cadmium efflux system protein